MDADDRAALAHAGIIAVLVVLSVIVGSIILGIGLRLFLWAAWG